MPDTNLDFLIGTMPDGKIIIDFRLAKVDHLKLTQPQALEMAEGLVQAVRDAKDHGIIIPTDTPAFSS